MSQQVALDDGTASLFQHICKGFKTEILIGSEMKSVCKYNNNSIRTNLNTKSIRICFLEENFTEYEAVNQLHSVTSLYLHKKLGFDLHRMSLAHNSESIPILFQVVKVEGGYPNLWWGRDPEHGDGAIKFFMPLIVVHQFNSALQKASNWYAPPAFWDGERHRLPIPYRA